MLRVYVKKTPYRAYTDEDVQEEKFGGGRKLILSADVENDIEKCLGERSKVGYPCSKLEILDLM